MALRIAARQADQDISSQRNPRIKESFATDARSFATLAEKIDAAQGGRSERRLRLPANRPEAQGRIPSQRRAPRRRHRRRGKLQKLGVIQYARGQITVLDRPQLEKLSCECYAVVKKETDRLLADRHLAA
jgi:hypothetical protein